MNVKAVFKTALKTTEHFCEKNLPTILISTGCVGSITAAVMACLETPKAVDAINAKKAEKNGNLNAWDYICATGPVYWPAALIEVASIGMIFTANSVSLKRQAAALGLAALSDGQLKDYKEAVKKQFGDKKEREVSDKVAEKIAKETTNNPIIITGNGKSKCIDALTGTPFECDYDKVKLAFEELNDMLEYNEFVSINDFYELLGLKPIEIGDDIGWHGRGYFVEDPISRERVLPEFSSQLDDNNVPCLVIGYSVSPKYNYKISDSLY